MVRIRRLALIACVSIVLANTGCGDSPTAHHSDATDELSRLAITSVSPDRGPLAGGTTVTITGANFTNISSVTIGGNELVNRVVVSATQITGTTPVAVKGGLSDVLVTSANGSVTCVECFGYLSPVVDLVAGRTHTCALTNTGAAYCWGAGGQLGTGSTEMSTVPVEVSGSVILNKLTAGGYHTCGLSTAGSAFCWGSNGEGQLGNGSTVGALQPVEVAGGTTFRALTAGNAHTCALNETGAASCWGQNWTGQLGNGSRTMSHVPVAVSGGLVLSAVSANDANTCGVTSEGAAYCWGHGHYGQLGAGPGYSEYCGSEMVTNCSTRPVVVSGGLAFTQVSVGGAHACGLIDNGAAYCWGLGIYGQLGTGSIMGSPVPVGVSGGVSFASVVAGAGHTCGLTSVGIAYCWGWNDEGQLGSGNSTNRSEPVAVTGNLRFDFLAAGGHHTCGLTQSGEIFCWGGNSYGELGRGSLVDSRVPVRVLPF